MKMRLLLSEEARREAFLRTGEWPKEEYLRDIPLEEISRESREILLEALEEDGGYLYVPGESAYTIWSVSRIPETPEDWEDLLGEWKRAQLASLHEEIASLRAEVTRLRQEEKKRWIAEHGSDHLKTALAEGYDCQRLYLAERAAQEFPGYEVDFRRQAWVWEECACPSPQALEEARRVGGRVVRIIEKVAPDGWSTCPNYEAVRVEVCGEYPAYKIIK